MWDDPRSPGAIERTADEVVVTAMDRDHLDAQVRRSLVGAAVVGVGSLYVFGLIAMAGLRAPPEIGPDAIAAFAIVLFGGWMAWRSKERRGVELRLTAHRLSVRRVVWRAHGDMPVPFGVAVHRDLDGDPTVRLDGVRLIAEGAGLNVALSQEDRDRVRELLELADGVRARRLTAPPDPQVERALRALRART